MINFHKFTEILSESKRRSVPIRDKVRTPDFPWLSKPWPRPQPDAALSKMALSRIRAKKLRSAGGVIKENNDQRDTLLAELKANFPTAFLKTSEEFSPNRQGGIWITGKEMADYYGKDNSGYDYYVNPKLQKILEKHGFYLEPLDPETWFAWPATPIPGLK